MTRRRPLISGLSSATVERYRIDGVQYEACGIACVPDSPTDAPTLSLGSDTDHADRVLPRALNQRLAVLAKRCAALVSHEVWSSPDMLAFGARIGARQKLKAQGHRSTTPVEGDYGYLLESNHEEVVEAVADGRARVIAELVDTIVERLQVLDEAEAWLVDRVSDPKVIEGYWIEHCAPAVARTGRRIPIVWYLAYLKLHSEATKRNFDVASAALTKYAVLSGLEAHPAGIASVFVEFLGEHLFAENQSGIGCFQNRYYFSYPTKPGQTLSMLYRERWEHMQYFSSAKGHVPSFARFFGGLLNDSRNALLADIHPDEPLLEGGVSSVWMMPPASADNEYQRKVDEMMKAIMGAPADSHSSAMPTAFPPPHDLPGLAVLEPVGSAASAKNFWFDVTRTIQKSVDQPPNGLLSLKRRPWAFYRAPRPHLREVELLGNREKELAPDSNSLTIPIIKQDPPVTSDPTAEIQRLAEGFKVPDYPMPPAVKRLQTILQSVSDDQIVSRKLFVEAANTLMRASGYRCRLEDGTLCLLRYSEPHGPPGYIQFSLPSRGAQGRLGKTKIMGLTRTPSEHGIR